MEIDSNQRKFFSSSEYNLVSLVKNSLSFHSSSIDERQVVS